ncbi:hypothetical protein TrST_g3720 [Triparma strigata]|uniref:Uncharacterized protein n=1 Tax=Triparma strigata TaxID=1606541 RepID=A0A9W6ZPW4_9STRA|nr:hypothetical protein TrST_g3720 [Triparma strigata]
MEEANSDVREERMKQVTKVVFLLNITKVGKWACWYTNLVVVEIPEGVESIDFRAFYYCKSLTSVSFPTTLKLVGNQAFWYCSSLVNVDLLHTNLQKIEEYAFSHCSELKSMTIPDSLQTLGQYIFDGCCKLSPHLDKNSIYYQYSDPSDSDSNSDSDSYSEDKPPDERTLKVIDHLRSLQS